jgi:hypothetical protein
MRQGKEILLQIRLPKGILQEAIPPGMRQEKVTAPKVKPRKEIPPEATPKLPVTRVKSRNLQ